MRLNRFVALAAGISRRKADDLIKDNIVVVDDKTAKVGLVVDPGQIVKLDGHILNLPKEHLTIMLNKPVGIVVSRNGQGSKTIYDILPTQYHSLNSVGRLDKNSSGLLIMTNDGILANELAHPSGSKIKRYSVELDRPLELDAERLITGRGVELEDGMSQFKVKTKPEDRRQAVVIMHQGKNRQIRRTFSSLGYDIKTLHRDKFGDFVLGDLKTGEYRVV